HTHGELTEQSDGDFPGTVVFHVPTEDAGSRTYDVPQGSSICSQCASGCSARESLGRALYPATTVMGLSVGVWAVESVR
ncbi:MAG: hypothetical protein ABGY41_06275, partial [Candidatus Poribacteria bacterium]